MRPENGRLRRYAHTAFTHLRMLLSRLIDKHELPLVTNSHYHSDKFCNWNFFGFIPSHSQRTAHCNKHQYVLTSLVSARDTAM